MHVLCRQVLTKWQRSYANKKSKKKKRKIITKEKMKRQEIASVSFTFFLDCSVTLSRAGGSVNNKWVISEGSA